MSEFYENIGFIIGFLIMLIVINIFFDEKITFYYLLITLLSMCLLNYEKVLYVLSTKMNL